MRGTRIALELLVEAFSDGASAEEIVLRYPPLDLRDVYAVLAYVLRDPDGVESYMAERAEREADARAGLPSEMTGLRRRLLARSGGG